MSQSNGDFIAGFHKNADLNFKQARTQKDDFENSTSYIEFIEMGRNRPSTNDQNIINDLVNMDAEYNPELLPNFSIGKLFGRPDNLVMQQSGRYGNFHTIDWLKDQAKDRYRHRWLREEKQNGHVLEKFQVLHDSLVF